ncbi:MAG TPA: alpha/beta hydrolase-fold protein [Alphaproteobacteria bacterium]|nr:alpha/beta hydrolase-fold protein [Alphaproteobacteria bacterium]
MRMKLAVPLALALTFIITLPAVAEPSSGCGRPPSEPPTAVAVDGWDRRVIVAVPEDYASDRPYPLVVAFHGRTNDNARVRRYYGLEEDGDAAIFAYPAGLRDDSGRFTWADPGDPGEDLRDYALFDRLLADLGARYCVDLDAVFVVGHSLGASFANDLACARGHRIRAVASVAGGISQEDCRDRVAALLLHNPDDRLVPVGEGRRARDVFLAENGFDGPPPQPSQIAGFACRRYGGGGHPVLWCPHDHDLTPQGRRYPHQWPPDAGAAIMAFFRQVAGLIPPPETGSAGSG